MSPAPLPVHPPCPGPSVVPTRQAKAMCCRATLWSGRLASSSVSPWAARRVKARQLASLTCVRLRAGLGAVGRAGAARGPPLGCSRCPWGAGVPGTPKEACSAYCARTLGVGVGHSLVEEQQVRGVELKVVLEAVQSGQVGQAAELGRAGACRGLAQPGAPSPCLSAALPSPSAWGPPHLPGHLDALSSPCLRMRQGQPASPPT